MEGAVLPSLWDPGLGNYDVENDADDYVYDDDDYDEGGGWYRQLL